MLIKNANLFLEQGSFVKKDIAVTGEFFTDNSDDGEILDARGYYAIPGLIDLHLHGCVGYDFSGADIKGIAEMAAYQAKNGVAAICPTTMTLPEEQLTNACKAISGYAVSGDKNGAAIAGINLEGPFVSPAKPGAQNTAFIQKPDAKLFYRLQEAANGMVRLLAVAPEADGAIELIEEVGKEITCSLAHTEADYETAARAYSKGARQVTHLYNAMPPFGHREPGVIGAAFDCKSCRAELICDGVHLHPSVVRASFAMFGSDRIILVSDSMMATGMEDGSYELGGLAVEVRGNTARLAKGGAIAGSVTNLMACLKTAVKSMGIPLADAVKCASVNPAKAIGAFDKRGSITPGKYADLVLLRDDLSIAKVFLRGRII